MDPNGTVYGRTALLILKFNTILNPSPKQQISIIQAVSTSMKSTNLLPLPQSPVTLPLDASFHKRTYSTHFITELNFHYWCEFQCQVLSLERSINLYLLEVIRLKTAML